MEKTITAGMVVKAEGIGGYYRVRSVRGGHANLCSPFGRQILHKRVPVTSLTECENEWYEGWSRSETYMSM